MDQFTGIRKKYRLKAVTLNEAQTRALQITVCVAGGSDGATFNPETMEAFNTHSNSLEPY